MNITTQDIIVWLIIGTIAGSLAGLVVKRKKEGFGRFVNVAIGLVGVLIGRPLFKLIRVDLGRADVQISLSDLLAGFVGALIFLALLALVKRWKRNRPQKAKKGKDIPSPVN